MIIYQCQSCHKYCDAQGAWLEIKSFEKLKEILAAPAQPILCLLCQEGFERQAAAHRQLPPSDR